MSRSRQQSKTLIAKRRICGYLMRQFQAANNQFLSFDFFMAIAVYSAPQAFRPAIMFYASPLFKISNDDSRGRF
jgi:hypothetical protein